MAGMAGRHTGRIIQKDRERLNPPPHLLDYARECADFSWDKARALLGGLPGGKGLNIAHEAVDRHAAGPLSGKLALRWIGKAGERRDLTYADLRGETNRFANALSALGVREGDSVAMLLPVALAPVSIVVERQERRNSVTRQSRPSVL